MPRNIAGSIVKGADFWGREREVDDLWRLLERGSVLLSAPRRHGKSSLMHALHAHPRQPWSVALTDLEAVVDPAGFVEKLTAAVLQQARLRAFLHQVQTAPGAMQRWFQRLIASVSVASPAMGELSIAVREAMDRDNRSWQQKADDLLASLGTDTDPVLIVLDEFPMMIGGMLQAGQQSDALALLRWFRRTRQERPDSNLTFLLGGSVDIGPRLTALGHDKLLNDLQRFRLQPWTAEQAVAFVTAVLEDEQVAFEPGVPGAFVECLGSGVPYHLQVMLDVARSVARREDRQLVPDDALAVCRDQLLGPEHKHLFAHYLTRLRELAPHDRGCRVLLGHLAGGRDGSYGALQASFEHAGLDADDVEAVVLLLEENFYVHGWPGTVSFRDGLLQAWWARNVPGVRR